jgi:hypothetical protein
MQPGQKWTRLKPDARDRQSCRREPSDQVVWLGCSLAFADDDPILVDDTNSRLVERDIQTSEILHENLLIMTRPDPIVVPSSGGRGDDRNRPILVFLCGDDPASDLNRDVAVTRAAASCELASVQFARRLSSRGTPKIDFFCHRQHSSLRLQSRSNTTNATPKDIPFIIKQISR